MNKKILNEKLKADGTKCKDIKSSFYNFNKFFNLINHTYLCNYLLL